MIEASFRFVKRLAVLLPVLVIGYLSIFNVFPELNEHLPAVLAAVITYILGAYVFVPGIIRLSRLFLPARHLPQYCVTADGFASDPLNIAVIGSRQQLEHVMRQAGWYEADKLTIKSGARLVLSTIYGWSYLRGPVSKLYLFGRHQDLAFQAPDNDGPRGSRHHVRFWSTTHRDIANLAPHTAGWAGLADKVAHDKLLWVGAASRDIGVTFIRYNFQLTHVVDPDTDRERDRLADDLVKVRGVEQERSVRLRSPYRLRNIRGLRSYLRTNGRMTILEITATGPGSSKLPRQLLPKLPARQPRTKKPDGRAA